MRKLLVYIAAPYTHPDPIANTRKAIDAWKQLWGSGFVPIVPHVSMLLHLVYPHDIETWYEYDMKIMERCDAVVRLQGDSTGADAETKRADELGIPVYREDFYPTMWALIDRMSKDML